jgi:GAF domain-containing protein
MVASGPRVRFYAGAPIRTPGGHLVGTLCILDVRPRDLSEAERGLLIDLAATVEGELARSDPKH